MSLAVNGSKASSSPFAPVDTFTNPQASTFGTRWEVQTDQSMGGQSQGELRPCRLADAPYLTLTGTVSLENTERPEDGGFIQATLPLIRSRQLYNAQAYAGVRIVCACEQAMPIKENHYALRLSTRELSMPWQYYTHYFQPTPGRQTFDLPFNNFTVVNTSHQLNPAYLMSLSITAGNDTFVPHLNIYEVGFYGNAPSL
jgi:hypothetical protein